MILKYQVDDDIVDYSLKLLDEAKSQDEVQVKDACTINGLQTKNIVKCYSDEQKIQIVKDIFLHQTLQYMHLVEYFDGGYQESHDHKGTDEYSFILYLNDADGDTLLYFDDMTIRITPKRGQVVFFKGDVLHEGLPSYQNKKVLVGGITCKIGNGISWKVFK